MSQAFYPNWEVSARPVSISHIKDTMCPQSSSLAYDSSATTSFNMNNMHFSGSTTNALDVLPAQDELNLIIFGITATTSGNVAGENPWAFGLFPDGFDYDIATLCCTAAGPVFYDMTNPIVLPKNTALKVLIYLGGYGANLLNLRFGYANVQGM